MPDIYDMLTEDHRTLAAVLRRLQDSTEATERAALFALARRELLLHTRFEEDVLYPQLRLAAGLAQPISEAEREHAQVRLRLAELAALDSGRPEWRDVVAELSCTVEHHVREEEQAVFPVARDALDDALAGTMASEYRVRKEKALAEA